MLTVCRKALKAESASPLLRLVGQDRIHPAFQEARPHLLDGSAANVEGGTEVRLAPPHVLISLPSLSTANWTGYKCSHHIALHEPDTHRETG